MESKLIQDIITTQNDLIDLKYEDRTFFTKSTLFTELIYNYGERVFYPRTTTPAVEFKAILTNWWARRGYHFNRLFDAFELEYNPIENTDRYETITDTTADNGTVSRGSNGTVTGTNSGVAKSNSWNATDSTVGKSSGDNTTTSSNTSADVSANNRVFEHDAHIHGNIGTMTSAQLLAGEKGVRMEMLYQDLLREFIDLYTSY